MKHSNLIIYKVYRRVISTLINLVARQTNYDISNTTLIIGSARSGTTFLMESINQDNEYRLIFEPFNNTYTSEWSKFATREYIDPALPEADKKNAIHKILIGQLRNTWIDRYNRKIRSNKRLIKAVRANLLVEHIRTEYPDLQIIYLVRNPYDVVASRINMNFDPRDIYQVLEQTDFLAKHYSDIDREALIKRLNTNEARHAALWCIENRYLLASIIQFDLHHLQYEDIIGKAITIKNNELRLIKKESKPSASSSLRETYKLSPSEKNNIAQILKLFGIEDFN